MELREGYKQTEVGVIPEDWVVSCLGDVGQFKNGINKGSESFGHGKPFINLLDVFGKNSLLDSESYGLVDSSDTERNVYDLKKGDVIFIRSSVKPSGVGLTAVVTEDLPQTVYSGFLIRFRDNGKIETNYKKYCFYEEGFRKKIISASSVSANTNINQDNLKRLTLPLPPTKTEQTAIANALSNADAWIQSLTRLIAKKCQIKQGAMQTLLNPYENGNLKAGWVVKKLGEVADLATGSTPPTNDKTNYGVDFLFVSPADLGKGKWIIHTEKKLSKKGFRLARKFPANSILFTCIGSTIGKAGMATVELTSNQQINAVLPNENFSSEYLYYLLSLIAPVIQASASQQAVPIINKTQFGETKVSLPINKKEQAHIGTVLSEMDAEINTLETKLKKAQQIKQGMMQNLLTGRTRLI